jgi:ACS family hexuronate transporter-like MFS transporter
MGLMGFPVVDILDDLLRKTGKTKASFSREFDYISSGEEEVMKRETNKEKVPWGRLLQYNQTWLFAVGKFMTDGVWWFFLFWLPAYLKAQYGIVDRGVMLPLAVLYTIATIGSVIGGWFPIYFIKKGHSAYDGRMKAMLLFRFYSACYFACATLGIHQSLGAYSSNRHWRRCSPGMER